MQNPGLEHLPLEAQDRIIALRSRVVELESQIKNLIEIDLVAFDKCRDELADHKDQIINLVEVQRRYRKALVFYACRANYDQYGVPHNDPKDWKDRVLLERDELKDRLEKLVDFIESPAFNDLLSEFQALLACRLAVEGDAGWTTCKPEH